MKPNHRSRRRFLRGAGGVTLALPFLAGLGSRRARADADLPKRIFIFTVTHNETIDMLPLGGPGRGLDLRETYLEPFQSFASKSIVVSNLDAGNRGHASGSSAWLTGRPGGTAALPIPTGGPSIDYLLADRWRETAETPISQLVLCTTDQYRFNVPGFASTYTAAGAAISPDYSPRAVFEKIYGPVGGMTGEDDGARQRALRLSLLDSVSEEHRLLQARLGMADRQRLDAHFSALRDQERRIQSTAMLSCEAPIPPDEWVRRGATTWRDNLPLLLDQAAGALMCGATRVVTMRSYPGTNSLDFIGVPYMRHDIAHGDTNSGAHVITDYRVHHARFRTWEAQQLLPLVERLDSTPDPDGEGSMLDNSAVVWLPELGISEIPSHRRDRMPAFIIGGAGGGFSTDQFFDAQQNYSYQDLLLTIVQGMGCTDVASFGDAGNTPISQILA